MVPTRLMVSDQEREHLKTNTFVKEMNGENCLLFSTRLGGVVPAEIGRKTHYLQRRTHEMNQR